MVGLEINAPMVRYRKKERLWERDKEIYFCHFILKVSKLCAATTGCIYLIYFMCNFIEYAKILLILSS